MEPNKYIVVWMCFEPGNKGFKYNTIFASTAEDAEKVTQQLIGSNGKVKEVFAKVL